MNYLIIDYKPWASTSLYGVLEGLIKGEPLYPRDLITGIKKALQEKVQPQC